MSRALTSHRVCTKHITRHDLNILATQSLEKATQALYQHSGGKCISALTELRYKLPRTLKLFDKVIKKIPNTTADSTLLTLKKDAQVNKQYLLKWIDVVDTALDYLQSPSFMNADSQ